MFWELFLTTYVIRNKSRGRIRKIFLTNLFSKLWEEMWRHFLNSQYSNTNLLLGILGKVVVQTRHIDESFFHNNWLMWVSKTM